MRQTKVALADANKGLPEPATPGSVVVWSSSLGAFCGFRRPAPLALWYQARTADGRASTRKTMIVALARKLLIGLWRFVTTGELLEGVILRPAG